VIKLHYYQIGTCAEDSRCFKAKDTIDAMFKAALHFYKNSDAVNLIIFGSSERI
jgi:hypothetical protein